MKREKEQGVCTGCKWSKDHAQGACYCIKYGIVIGYPKADCRGCEREQVRKQEMGT